MAQKILDSVDRIDKLDKIGPRTFGLDDDPETQVFQTLVNVNILEAPVRYAGQRLSNQVQSADAIKG